MHPLSELKRDRWAAIKQQFLLQGAFGFKYLRVVGCICKTCGRISIVSIRVYKNSDNKDDFKKFKTQRPPETDAALITRKCPTSPQPCRFGERLLSRNVTELTKNDYSGDSILSFLARGEGSGIFDR